MENIPVIYTVPWINSKRLECIRSPFYPSILMYGPPIDKVRVPLFSFY